MRRSFVVLHRSHPPAAHAVPATLDDGLVQSFLRGIIQGGILGAMWETPNPEEMTEQPSILPLGDVRLRQRSALVERFDRPFKNACSSLAATLAAFRARYRFGRAISAPQIGLPLRLIAANLGDGLFFVVNPTVIDRSAETFTMWDDCMSFPDLLVRVERHASVSLEFCDEKGAVRCWRDLDVAAAELFQHEIDHLDGVLAIDRAIDRDSLVLRTEFEMRRQEYLERVDYTIDGGMRGGSTRQ